ncbi:MAG: nucleotidyltransferase domain-containing protein [Ignisphaera sp.]
MATLGMWVCRPYSNVLKKLLNVMLDALGDNLVSVVVFGSVARCEARRDSDIDLLIVVREAPRSRLRR